MHYEILDKSRPSRYSDSVTVYRVHGDANTTRKDALDFLETKVLGYKLNMRWERMSAFEPYLNWITESQEDWPDKTFDFTIIDPCTN